MGKLEPDSLARVHPRGLRGRLIGRSVISRREGKICLNPSWYDRDERQEFIRELERIVANELPSNSVGWIT